VVWDGNSIRNSRNLKYLRAFGVVATIVAGAVLFVYLFGAMVVDIEGLAVRVTVVPVGQGETVVELPPFGCISADTHSGPVLVKLRLEKVETDVITKALATGTSHQDIIEDVQIRAQVWLKTFVVRQMALGALGALVLVVLVWRPRRWPVLLGTVLTGALVVGLALVGTVMTYDVEAFREPQYEGAIAMAPDAVRIADRSLTNLSEIKGQADLVVSSIKSLFTSMESITVLSNPQQQGEVRKILLISDLHSNPLGVQLTRTIAQKFNVDGIINAGDLTDFGSPLETRFVEEMRGLGVRQIFVAGNHDTPEVTKFMAGMPQTVVLDRQGTEVGGIRVVGAADSLSFSPDPGADGEEVIAEDQIQAIEHWLQEQERPDILVVHRPNLARRLAAYASLVVTGHTHQQSLTEYGEAIIINPGSTGAAGIRGLYSEDAVYSAVILHYSPDIGPVAADLIKYDPVSKQFSLERRLLGNQ